jgi:hypothetical protein
MSQVLGDKTKPILACNAGECQGMYMEEKLVQAVILRFIFFLGQNLIL